ncbi:macrophage mannose receptor 1 isoform X2 [Kryptolebias marmoratus]|uniref:Macrophage mannose receptor 1-like n=2 Tax=Kryptolebias marmoratus TaxID=37003 RepID=A0A3Q2ZCC5_KRYMA|nr:macrophage mannose receptor 1 isoform X2 [Kryptolebias marmoratus]
MKNSISGPFLLLFLSSLGSGLTSVVSKQYMYHEKYLTWEEAQNHCKKHYRNLATFYAQSDVDSLVLNRYHTWISLREDKNNGSGWNLFSSELKKIFRDSNENDLNSTDVCAAVNYDHKTIDVEDCEDLLFFICEKNENQSTEYEFIPEAKNWSDAFVDCEQKGYDLAIFSYTKWNQFFTVRDFPVWIGLHRDGESWNWSSGFSSYINWELDESSNDSDCVSISSMTKKMTSQKCEDHFPFVCISENVFLFKENKTWEEALERCRGLTLSSSDRHFDLLSVEPEDHEFVWNKVMEAETMEVWTGLHFLVDEWLWVNGKEMLYPDLPLCPIPGHYCGALSKNDTGSVETRDCFERKNFLCYSYI